MCRPRRNARSTSGKSSSATTSPSARKRVSVTGYTFCDLPFFDHETIVHADPGSIPVVRRSRQTSHDLSNATGGHELQLAFGLRADLLRHITQTSGTSRQGSLHQGFDDCVRIWRVGRGWRLLALGAGTT